MQILCPKCKSNDIRKKGFRYNKSIKKQKYQCCICKHFFIEDDGFKKMRHKPTVIVRAVHQHIDGMSLFKTQYHLWQHDAVKVTRKTIGDWTKKYSNFLKSASPMREAKAKGKAAFR